jgi:hydroxymethylglutaryl-CoA lyase
LFGCQARHDTERRQRRTLVLGHVLGYDAGGCEDLAEGQQQRAGRFPEIVYIEEGMREGMQSEDANIPIDAKVALLEALSETGLKRIVVGSFVSPRYTPQMARIDELMHTFHPKAGVTYMALALNEQGVERAQQYSPPLTIERSGCPTLRVHMCDIFARRNANRTPMQEMAAWPHVIARAKAQGTTEAGMSTNASFGSKSSRGCHLSRWTATGRGMKTSSRSRHKP